jgi:galactokinase
VVGPAQFLIEAFEARYHRTPDLFRAPGRVNLIGEFTDFNLGFVLPIAIDLACYAASAPNREGLLRVYSENLQQIRQWQVDQIATLRPSGDWSDYVVGVARQLPPRGLDLLIHSDVPLGSGLSSSAALEVATALALGWDGALPSLDLAKLCRRAENDFVGLPSGIMDQYVSIFGRKDSALLIDCRSLESEAVEIAPGVAIVAVNSMVKHELGKSAYGQRVSECSLAVAQIGGAASLRDVTVGQLEKIHDPLARQRARHVVSENQRVLDFVAASRGGDLGEMGRLLVASHRSLQHDFEVSCEELDFLVDAALKVEGVFGARMTGGGFGGCTVNLVAPESVDQFEQTIRNSYAAKFGIEPAFYRVNPSEGAQRIS